MPVYSIDAIYGAGKTAFCVYHSLRFNQLNPNAKIYSNFNYNISLFKFLNYEIPNFIFTPLFVLPLTEIIESETTLIIIDDLKSLYILVYLIKMIASISRKVELDILITAQYYAMFSAELRFLSTYIVDLMYNKNTDELYVKLFKSDDKIIKFKIIDMKYYVFPFYDTKQVVDFPTKERVIKEILRVCKTKSDIDDNINFIFGNNKRIQDKVKKIIYLKKGYDISFI